MARHTPEQIADTIGLALLVLWPVLSLAPCSWPLLAVVGAGVVEASVRSMLGRKYETHRMLAPLPSGVDVLATERGAGALLSSV